MSGKLAAEDAMDLSQGKIIDGDNEILTTDTKVWLKHLNINRLANPLSTFDINLQLYLL